MSLPQPPAPNLLIDPGRRPALRPRQRGCTIPYVGKWNCETNQVTTGQTQFAVGTGLPLHSHNVEESVFILARSGDRRDRSGILRPDRR